MIDTETSSVERTANHERAVPAGIRPQKNDQGEAQQTEAPQDRLSAIFAELNDAYEKIRVTYSGTSRPTKSANTSPRHV